MEEILLIGLDAASSRQKFGYSIGHWSSGVISIETAGCLAKGRLDNLDALSGIAQRLHGLPSATRALVAVDAPLGWPKPLADNLAVHRAGEALNSEKDALFKRTTDLHLKTRGYRPLEIGADRIARAAVEALTVLTQLRSKSGRDIPLAWTLDYKGQAAIEVYPAATLQALGLPHTNYKGAKNLDARRALATNLESELPGLHRYAEGDINAFDAALCLLCARDFLQGYCAPPTERRKARKEGWIWVRNTTAGGQRQDGTSSSPTQAGDGFLRAY